MDNNNRKAVHIKYQPKGFMFYFVDIIAIAACMIIGYTILSSKPDKDYAIMVGILLCMLGVIAIIVLILTLVTASVPTKTIKGKVIDKQSPNIYIIELPNGVTDQFIANKGVYLVVNDEGEFCIRGKAILGFDGWRG